MAGNTEFQTGHHIAERLAAEGVETITAGFPCQDISYAGRGAGLSGSRSGLFWDLMRTVRLVRPRELFLENVAALLNRGMGTVLGEMATIRYDAEWHCLPAAAVGAPHRRDRIFIFATDAGTETVQRETLKRDEPHRDHERAGNVADVNGVSWDQRRSCDTTERPRGRDADRSGFGQNGIRDPDRQGLAVGESIGRNTLQEFAATIGTGWWGVEPDVGRVADGVPKRVDRLRCLGNGVVSLCPEYLARNRD